MKRIIPNINTTALLATIAFFSLFGPLCIYRAWLLHGAIFVQASFKNILGDPIYQYAVADLGAIFTIFSVWIYRECKANQTTFWYWPILLFIFGTPGLAIYLFFRNKN